MRVDPTGRDRARTRVFIDACDRPTIARRAFQRETTPVSRSMPARRRRWRRRRRRSAPPSGGGLLLRRSPRSWRSARAPRSRAPLRSWAQLALAVLAGSTAGVAFGALPAVPPLALGPGACRARPRSSPSARGATPRARTPSSSRAGHFPSTPSLAASERVPRRASARGWSAGLQNTSLAHALSSFVAQLPARPRRPLWASTLARRSRERGARRRGRRVSSRPGAGSGGACLPASQTAAGDALSLGAPPFIAGAPSATNSARGCRCSCTPSRRPSSPPSR